MLPAVETRLQLLPIGQLAWDDFERLCLRLLEHAAEPVHVSEADPVVQATAPFARLYGVGGQAQSGIDVYARVPLVPGETPPERRFVSLQARRIEKLFPAALRGSVEDFLAGRWASVSRMFVYATSASARSTKLADEIEILASRLLEESIEFVVWDEEAISARLKACPELVDDFFGREWVEHFCGGTAAQSLGTRLDAAQVAGLRRDLDRIYRAAFGVADSGRIACRWAGTTAGALRDRFVTPDLVSSTLQAASFPQSMDGPVELDMDEDAQALLSEAVESNAIARDENAWFLRSSGRRQHRLESPRVSERMPADQWMGTQPRQVIVGEPGAGKSTLLRFLVLDLLSEEPNWREVAARWGDRLPVWLPFHFFTQRVAGHTGAEASVGEALKAWLKQHDSGHVWPLVEAALDDDRLLLVVDGLDEWISDEAGRYGLTALQTFADARDVPLVVSTRPFGLDRLTLGADWTHARIAPLTPVQQRSLASPYFHASADTEDGSSAQGVIERSVDDFLSQVCGTSDLRAIGGVPLFLVLLVGLHLSSNARLPAGRFEVYERAVQLLVADHRAQRRAAAAVTAPRQGLTDDQLRRVLAKVAFESQLRGHLATLQEAALRADFIDALRDPDGLAMEPAAAAATADDLMAIAEGELGLLVRAGPTDLEFLHRMLQEQLAAEFISDRYSPAEATELLEEHVGDPRWSQVILATMWRIKRPGELRQHMEALSACVDSTPAGLRARELVAELTFGPYDLPTTDIQRYAPDIIEAIETHTYGPHRARLLESIFIGLEGAATGDIVRGCLERWTLRCQEPSTELVRAIAEAHPAEDSSETICKLLMRALRHPDTAVAYTSGLEIAKRCSDSGIGTQAERGQLREDLLQVLSDPPSGLAAAAAVVALALEWRDDPSVGDILNEARFHAEESVRVVALSDALGVLRPVLLETPRTRTHDGRPLSADESEWLFGRLMCWPSFDSHQGLLVAAVAEVARSRDSALEFLIETLRGSTAYLGYRDRDLAWAVTLDAFADDDRVVDLVCDQLRYSGSSYLVTLINASHRPLLAPSYAVGSRHNGRVAEAVEDLVDARDGSRWVMDYALPGLAAVDRGSNMKKLLLQRLADSPFPNWAANALADHFSDDSDVRTTLRAALMDDPVRASRVATVATTVLPAEEVFPRLLAILQELRDSPGADSARYDIVAAALIHASREHATGLEPELEEIADKALTRMPSIGEPARNDPRYEVAAAFHPSQASTRMLADLAHAQDRPLVPYLRAFSGDPAQTGALLGEAEAILCSLPAHLRARVCQSLADGATTPELARRLTSRWADEVSEPNKSIASLAYHRSLRQARQDGHVDDGEWNAAMTRLGEQASCYGPDHEARRRGAWVGICVCGDWSVLKGRVETIGAVHPVGVSLVDVMHGPDRTLLQQIVSRWEDLRSEFGDMLLSRLSGIRERQPSKDVWGALALAAHQNVTLEQELDSVVAAHPELLKLEGVLAWFVTQGNKDADTVADVLVSQLQSSEGRGDLASVLLAEPERIGLRGEDLQGRLENALSERSAYWGDPVLEALALLCPESPAVVDAWKRFSDVITNRQGREDHLPPGHTYFAVAFAAADTNQIPELLNHCLKWLDGNRNRYDDDICSRHITHRLRRDDDAAAMVQAVVMHSATPDTQAALLVSLLAQATGLDGTVLAEANRRLAVQHNAILAPIVRDRTVGATHSVRTIFTRIADTAWAIPPN